MKTVLYLLLIFAAAVLPVCAIYWFMVRELLLAMFRGRLLRLFVELRAFAVHQQDGHPALIEALNGQLACMALVHEMRHLDMGDVFAKTSMTQTDPRPIATDPRIALCDADQLRAMHGRFAKIAMAIVLINSPMWFPVIAMVVFVAQWSRLACHWTNLIHRGLMALVDLGNHPPGLSPLWG